MAMPPPDRRQPHWEAGRAESLPMQSEPGDMRGGFGCLAQPPFPAGRPPYSCTSEKYCEGVLPVY